MLRVRSPQDLGAGVMFVLIGLAGYWFGRDLAFGSASRMGPGYFPMLLSGLIMAIRLVVGSRGLTVEGPPVERVQLRAHPVHLRRDPDLRFPDPGRSGLRSPRSC